MDTLHADERLLDEGFVGVIKPSPKVELEVWAAPVVRAEIRESQGPRPYMEDRHTVKLNVGGERGRHTSFLLPILRH